MTENTKKKVPEAKIDMVAVGVEIDALVKKAMAAEEFYANFTNKAKVL